MAIAKGNVTKEAQDFKRYIGVSSMFVKAVNPNKNEYEALFNTTLDNNPEYVTDVTDNDGNTYKNAKIQVVFQMAKDKYPSDAELLKDFNDPEGTKISMTIFVQNKHVVGAASGKIKVIDKYGRTAWATPEDVKTKSIPVYSNGPADIDKDYRPAYVGEEELVKFIKTFLDIKDVTVWDNNLRKRVPNTKVKPEECECMLESIDNIFKGDVSEVKEAVGFMQTNRIKVLLGVKTDMESGKLYQAVYTKSFLNNAAKSYKSLEKEIQEMYNNAAANGRMVNTEYQIVPVKEYSVEPTTIIPSSEPSPAEDPFASTGNSSALPWD